MLGDDSGASPQEQMNYMHQEYKKPEDDDSQKPVPIEYISGVLPPSYSGSM